MPDWKLRTFEGDIAPEEASCLINKLYSFMGTANIEKALKKHTRALKLSGPIVSEFSLKHKHPWWNALFEVEELRKKGKSIKKSLTPGIKRLVGDAKKIVTLQHFMPQSVKHKYKRDLLGTDRAADYLFEIQIAWHYYLNGNNLEWYEDGQGKRPEFLVKTPNFDFNVECKRISVDLSRKVKRQDFHRLSQEIAPKIAKKDYGGKIDIALNERFQSNQIETTVSDIMSLVNSNNISGTFTTETGNIYLDLQRKSRRSIDASRRYHELCQETSGGSHFALWSSEMDGDKIIDPIEIGIKSAKPDELLNDIYDKAKKACKEQLDETTPGILVCFLEEVYDLQSLGSESGLQIMTCTLLNEERFSHIAAVVYCSEPQMFKSDAYEVFNNQKLLFRNPNCKFSEVKDYPF